jgi:type IV pilus assembly protein PilF
MKTPFLFAAVVVLALGGCASQAEREAEAARVAKQIEAHTNLGAAYLARNKLDVAQKELERALEIDPDSSQANNIMALLQIRLKNDEKAEKHFRHAISEKPDNSDARNNYGVFLCERGRLGEADEQFRTAIKSPLYQSPEQANMNAGICQLKKPDTKAAAAYFRAALKASPQYPPALLHMARLSFDANEMLPARGFMQRFFEAARDTPEALLLAFRIERALGAKDAQASYAVRLRGKFPDSAEAKQLRMLTGK